MSRKKGGRLMEESRQRVLDYLTKVPDTTAMRVGKAVFAEAGKTDSDRARIAGRALAQLAREGKVRCVVSKNHRGNRVKLWRTARAGRMEGERAEVANEIGTKIQHTLERLSAAVTVAGGRLPAADLMKMTVYDYLAMAVPNGVRVDVHVLPPGHRCG